MSVELMIRVTNLPAHGQKSFRFIAFLVIIMLIFGRSTVRTHLESIGSNRCPQT